MTLYKRLTAKEYYPLIVKYDKDYSIYLSGEWVPFNASEFLWPEGLFSNEWKDISEIEAKEEMLKHDKTINRCLNLAEQLAREYHKTQKDKANKPYINHILSVVSGVNTKEEKIIAYLHDTLEDTDLTEGKLRQHRFPEFIISHVKILTHDKSEDYFDYVNRIKYYPLARNVKIADLRNNSDLSRIANPKEKDYLRLEKYKKALDILKH